MIEMINRSSKIEKSRGPLLLPRLPVVNLGPISSSSSSSSSIGRSQALKVHSQAEKRRRERINEHLATLRRMVPQDATKMDKASLLSKVIDQVKDLKRQATEASKSSSVPAEANEVMVEAIQEDNNSNLFYMKASVCCDDRPDLFMNLMKAFRALKLRAVRADITSLGGRVQTVFVLCGSDSNVSSLKEAVKDALARIASLDMVSINVASSSKRQREAVADILL